MENFNSHSRKAPNQALDLRDIILIMWAYKWLITAITALFAIGSVVFVLLLPNIYEAEAKLAPTEEAQGGGMGQMSGQLGGLASLAGVSLGGGTIDTATLALEIARSRRFISEFAARRNILPDLMAAESWSLATGELSYDSDIYDPESGQWFDDGREAEPPTNWELVREFRRGFFIDRDEVSGIVTFRIEHVSPIVAQKWVNWLIEDLNNEMRRRDVVEAQKSVEYLEAQLQEVRLASMQQVLNQLLEKQAQTVMLANVRPEYVFRIVDPAVVAEQRAKPMRSLLVVMITFIGGLIAVMVAFIVNMLRTGSDA